ncbi:NADP-dependent succinate-semialdehyde dehydrogenase [Enterovibrio norvegicus]|uniref:NADP-dependent succinate-semialdehyde dehydrogenase n=1 Tax=Enterovibrio norvegicus TaxID=188144 RepID=UPI000C852F14|nr:NADP-dependent succinate-semialdehyde dehydrogenase [Enterovibrio norvegicus]PMN72220.1 succinate-semialdehyde dehydrogenase (NADP(+)) [Enterovibrio norvegicus]
MKLTDHRLLKQRAYIDGVWRDAISGATFPVLNPASDEVLVNVPRMGREETQQAIRAAEKALVAWQSKTAKERSTILRRWFDLMLEHQDDLAQILTAEQGKPIAEAKGEIAYAASYIEWFAEEGKRIYGDTIPGHQSDKRLTVIKQPVGVTAAITPWNFPAAMIARKVAPALAAGCSMVVKPAEQTPLSAFALAQLAEWAGVPAGVFNVVTGDPREIGAEICESPVVRKLSFTGSTATGITLMSQSAPTVKKLSMELGGNAPFIVFDDADLDAAVEGAMLSKFRNAGQTCVCANRIYVQLGVYDAFAEKLTAAVKKLHVGRGTDEGVTTGPLINENAVLKVEKHIDNAVSQGAVIATGGKRHALGGTFFEPTVLTNMQSFMDVAQEETFGPLAPLFCFDDDDDVVAMANDTEFGLAAYFYAKDISRIWRVAEKLEYGMVGINTGMISTEVAPFGGIKASGFGREGSRYGIEDYLEIKYLCVSV